MKKYLYAISLAVVAVLSLFNVSAYAVEDANAEENLTHRYGEYATFEELYDAYFEAVDSGDSETAARLLEIAEITLQEDIERSENLASVYSGRVGGFFDYFYEGYWETRSNGLCLSLFPVTGRVNWTDADKLSAWNHVYSRYSGSSNWDNTACMKEQFYCHARLAYAIVEDEWNLEPWKTSINAITCN